MTLDGKAWAFLDLLTDSLVDPPPAPVSNSSLEEMPDLQENVVARRIKIRGVDYCVAVDKQERAVEIFMPSRYSTIQEFNVGYTTNFIYDLLKTMYPQSPSPHVSIQFSQTCLDLDLADWFDGVQYQRIFKASDRSQIMDIIYYMNPRPALVVPSLMMPQPAHHYFMYGFDFSRSEPRETIRMSLLSARAIEPQAVAELIIRHRGYRSESGEELMEDVSAFRSLLTEVVKLGANKHDNWA